MNRKLLIAAAAAALALSLAGCAGSSSQVPTSSPASSPASSAAAGVQTASASASNSAAPASGSNRPATTELEFLVEGTAETVPATLFQGEGYSLYLPDGAWKQTAQASPDQPEYADVFTAADNDAVTLSVRPNRNGLTLEEAYDALLSEGYLQSDDNDHMFGRNADGSATCVYVTEQDGQVWYVSWSYPDTPEYLEGWGSRLPQIAATFAADGSAE